MSAINHGVWGHFELYHCNVSAGTCLSVAYTRKTTESVVVVVLCFVVVVLVVCVFPQLFSARDTFSLTLGYVSEFVF